MGDRFRNLEVAQFDRAPNVLLFRRGAFWRAWKSREGDAFSVKSSALPDFGKCCNRLPPNVQKIARKNFALWQKQPSLKSLAFKRMKRDLWSVRAGSGFRALATFDDGRFLWFWIGAHDDYERLLRKL